MRIKTKIWWKNRVLFGGLRVGKSANPGARPWVFDCIVKGKDIDLQNLKNCFNTEVWRCDVTKFGMGINDEKYWTKSK